MPGLVDRPARKGQVGPVKKGILRGSSPEMGIPARRAESPVRIMSRCSDSRISLTSGGT